MGCLNAHVYESQGQDAILYDSLPYLLKYLTKFTYWFDWMASHLRGVCLSPPIPVWMLLIHMTTPSCFTWVLGMQTQVLMFTQQALYLLSHLPSPKMILGASFLNWLKSTWKLSTISHQFLSVTLRNFWLLIKIIFKDPFQNNWSRLLANAAFIFVRESIVILTKDCFLSIILHCTQMECLWGGGDFRDQSQFLSQGYL